MRVAQASRMLSSRLIDRATPSSVHGMQPESRTRVLEVGGYGWLRPDWLEDFYPEDLPGDWRLAFYANEFRMVCVPAAYWRGVAVPDPVQWREDARERFEFWLEVDAALAGGPQWPAFLAAAPRLEDNLGGIVLDVEEAGLASAAEADLRRRLPHVTVLAGGVPGAMSGAVVWAPGRRGPCGPFGRLALTATPAPRELRSLLEALMAATDGPSVRLCLDAPVAVLRDVAAMARLLGH